MKVLLFMGSYLPGTKSAGVTTSVSNMVKNLYPDVEFYIITADRDIGDEKSYNGVPLEQWIKYGFANVFYSAKYKRNLRYLRSVINDANCDVYYLNGFYNISDNFRGFLLYFAKLIEQKPLVVAPRGIFSLGEANNKKIARWCYRQLFRIMGLTQKTYWHASSDLEKRHILDVFPEVEDRIHVIPDISDIQIEKRKTYLEKIPGEAKVMFISRISKKKNIKLILNVLAQIKGKVIMDFYGMIGNSADKKYWSECEEIITSLPSNIKCNYIGQINHNDVRKVYLEHHIFFFPTYGENYGHVVAESLAYGCPILLSDTTPWNMIETNNAGWNIPIHNVERYVSALQEVINMDQGSWDKLSNNASMVAQNYMDINKLKKSYDDFFFSLETV